MKKLTDFIEPFKAIKKIEWRVTENENGIKSFPFPVYPEAVREFERVFYSSDEFQDFDYIDHMRKNGWNDIDKMENDIPKMTKDNIATCITAIIRDERFSDGTIAEFLENGVLVKLLERLKEISDEK